MFGRATIRLGIGPHSSLKYGFVALIIMVSKEMEYFVNSMRDRPTKSRFYHRSTVIMMTIMIIISVIEYL